MGKKFVSAAVIAAGVGLASSASASSLTVVAESAGNTFTATLNGTPVFVGLIGFNNAAVGEVITPSLITSLPQPPGQGSRILGIFNGQDLANRAFDSGSGFDSTVSSSISIPNFFSGGADLFTGATLTDGGRAFGVALIAFEGASNLVLSTGVGGTATINTNGSRGDLGEIGAAAIIPLPTTAGLAGLGLGLVALRRRR